MTSSNSTLAELLVAFSSAQHDSPQTAQPKQVQIVRAATPHDVGADDANDDCNHLLKASVSDPHQMSGITGSAHHQILRKRNARIRTIT